MVTEDDFTSFHAAVFARLVGQVSLVTGDRHEAEDVVQEALARASVRWSRLRRYDVALAEALRTLPVGQRQALVLHYLLGMPVKEVAATLRVPTGTVKARLHRGRRALAAQLDDEEVENRHVGA